MNKKIISMALTFMLTLTSFGMAAAKAAPTVTKAASIAAAVKKETPLNGLTPAERRKLGYTRKNALGVEYKIDSSIWKKYDDFVYNDYPEESDPEDITKPIFDGRYVSFISSDLLKQYDETSKITDKAQRRAKRIEILSKGKDIYSIVVYRKDKLPGEEQIKKDVKMPNMTKLGEDGGYVFYFGYANYDEKELPKDDIAAYKALYDDAMVIRDTIMIFKPVTPDEGIKSIKKLEFKLKDLDEKEVTENIFKENKITMINIWATYCGYCIDEMPYLQELAGELKDKGFGVLGIVGDVYANGTVDQKLLELAKKIVKETGVKYPSLIPDDNMKYDNILSFINAYPTTLFVDSQGSVVGDVIIGERSKAEYEKIIVNMLNLTPAEKRTLGFTKKNSLGVEYKIDSSIWKKYDDFVYNDYPEESDPEDITKPIFDGRYVSFISSDLLKQYDETSKITDKTQRTAKRIEILSKGKDIYSIIVYRKDKLPKEEQIEKDVKMPNMIKLGEDGGYVFYFGYIDYDEEGLPKDDIAAYKALYDDAMVIRDTITVFKPIPSEEGIKGVKKLQFKLKDLDGNEVTESIFKENKLTMVNLWATYCGYCIDEMPYLQELAAEFKDKKFGILGIAGDVYSNGVVDEKLLELAKKIVKETGVKYPSLIPDEGFKYDSVLAYLVGYPTTFFVDSEGNIVGDVIIGSLTKEEFKKVIEDMLSKVK